MGRDCGGRRAAQRGVFPTGAALRAILAECEADNPLLPDDTPTEPVGLVGAGMTLSAVEAPRRENVL
ncbi:hypothetical protein ACSL103130_05415 [Actinomyces slackii]|uniref:Uncharacterized protein n=1 Tax=Actinomyces slackii TaxID=52774 RepID=A0A3S5EM45_9ACTO|nr:Uncharacterised protein [Actinomyces slackii]